MWKCKLQIDWFIIRSKGRIKWNFIFFFSENSIFKKNYRSNLGFWRRNSGQLTDLNFKRPKKSLKKFKNISIGSGYHAQAQLLPRYMSWSMIARVHTGCTPRLGHKSQNPPSERTSSMLGMTCPIGWACTPAPPELGLLCLNLTCLNSWQCI